MNDLASLLTEIRACRLCEAELPLGPRPVLQVGGGARVLIVGQAPGQRVHESGVPFNDASGIRLRNWLGVDRGAFYDPARFAIMPMGFCYPGRGASGDLPPRRECSATWHPKLMRHLDGVGLTLLVGHYAQAWFLGEHRGRTLTDTVRAWRDYLPRYVPLPHPSPRNQLWLRSNPWFEEDVLPELRIQVAAALRPREAAASA
jgi:uracil-DNA glycosylase